MNIDGNLYALRQHEKRQDAEQAREEHAEDIKHGFVDDIVAAVYCVMKNELGITVEDSKIESILLNEGGDKFLDELAELVVEMQAHEQDCYDEGDWL